MRRNVLVAGLGIAHQMYLVLGCVIATGIVFYGRKSVAAGFGGMGLARERPTKVQVMTKRRLDINKQVLKSLLRLYAAFVAILLFFVVIFQIEAVHETIVVPFTSLVAEFSGSVMNIFGAGARVHNNHLSTSSYSINIVDGCNGIYATAILISGVLAFPSRFKEKLWGILLGVAAIFALNLVRVISLFYLGQFYPDVFEEVHVYVWQPIIILWAIFVWDFWSRKIKKEA